MKLIDLKLRNFKGIKEFDITPGGESQAIFGDNGTGKTTLFDAFSWLLFDKDSANRSDFEIKTLGPDGEAIHGLEHEVEAAFSISGRPLLLKKVYSETWAKKRGSATKQFIGHTTSCFLDGVPVKKNEYEARIAEIVGEDAFKLLTNPRHFNEVLHWQDRRKLLLEVCGDLRDADVIAHNTKLAKLPDILSGHTLEDHRKIIMARRILINKDIETIPVRINEVMIALPNIVDDASTAAELKALRTEQNAKAQELANLEAGGGVAEKTKELRLIEADIAKAESERWVKANDQIQSQKNELKRLEGDAIALEAQTAGRRAVLKDKQAAIIEYEVKMEALRENWHALNAETFSFEQTNVCPTCGQALPAEQVEAARSQAILTFNGTKANKLLDITDEGKALKTRTDQLRIEAGELELVIAANEESSTGMFERKTALHDAILAAEKEDQPALPAYVDLLHKKSLAEQEIMRLQNSNVGAVKALRLVILNTHAKIEACEATVARAYQRKRGLERIEELKAEERTLAKEFEKLEAELSLADEFVKTKVSLLETRINSRFLLARFKLFNELVNGGIEEVCETTYLGVPYGSALNNSARINIGLDIINTLNDHFQFVAPIWIDNAEAVTQLVATKGQQITLYVSEADKVLRIEGAKESVA